MAPSGEAAPAPSAPAAVIAPLPAAGQPSVAAPVPALSPASGGAAASLFPALAPKPSASGHGKKARTRPVAETSALSEGEPVANAQLAGLAALALAFVLAVTRLSVRRPAARPAPRPEAGPAQEPPAAGKPAAASDESTPPAESG